MDMQSLLNLAKQSFDSNGDGNLDMTELMAALSSLTGNSSAPQGNLQSLASGFNLSSLVSQLQSGGLENVVSSWLGNGANAQVSGNDLVQSLGSDKIAAFANQLGISQEKAVAGLQTLLPQMIDHSSQDGHLQTAAQTQGEGLGGMLGGLAGSFFNKK